MNPFIRQCLLVHRLGTYNTNSKIPTVPVRHIHLGLASLARTHYDVLEITPKATQADVKTAYYKLSMIYHPDKNKGNPDSEEKFKDITAAYEVLSNLRLRKMYDRGVGRLSESGFDAAKKHDRRADVVYETEEEPEPDDPQTKFYKRHMTRSETPHASGRTPIYNFDEWTEAHYGKAFARKQTAQTRYRERQTTAERNTDGVQTEFVVFGFLMAFVSLFFLCFQLESTDKAIVKKKPT